MPINGCSTQRSSKPWISLIVATTLTGAVSLSSLSAHAATDPYTNPYTNPYANQTSRSDIERVLNLDERKLIQEGLVWQGFYNGWIDGQLGQGTRDAIIAWQRDNKARADGELDEDQVVALGGSALSFRDQTGWQPMLERRSGITFSYPSKILSRSTNSEPNGVILDHPDGMASLMTLRITDAVPGQIDTLYDQLANSGQSQIGYNFRRDNLFITSGNRGSGKFYSRYEQRGNEIRGYDLIWKNEFDSQMQAISVLISNTFEPFDNARPLSESNYPTLVALAKARKQSDQGGSTRSASQAAADAYPSQQRGGGSDYPSQQTNAYPSQQNGGAPAQQGNGYPSQQSGGYPSQQNDAYPSQQQGGQQGASPDGKGVYFTFDFVPPKSPELQAAYQYAQDANLLERNPEITGMSGMFMLKRQLHYVAMQCNTVNAFYSPKDGAIVLCYEMVEYLRRSAVSFNKPDPQFVDRYIKNNLRFILLHETGHALIDLLNLASTGREEDAVDQLAAVLILLNVSNEETSRDIAQVLQMTALWFKSNASVSSSNPGVGVFADEHSLNEQRYFNLLCIVYGSDPDLYGGIIDNGMLPEARAARCPDESSKIFGAWSRLLVPHFAPAYQYNDDKIDDFIRKRDKRRQQENW